MLTLFDAGRCPFAARVRIMLAEKDLEYEAVEIDLDDRPAWLYEKNPLGRVPVIEEDGLVLPESLVILEYLEERYPEPSLWPADAAQRALARLQVQRFDRLGDPYYALRRGETGARTKLDAALAELDLALAERRYLSGADYGLADIAYVPWLLRARDTLGVPVGAYGDLESWLERVGQRPAVAAEAELVGAL